jgi:4-diphosphocytidyl-2-C-methyl-D-erythritol kinase
LRESLTLPAPAKLNLFLHILGKRKDNYHNIQTVFHILELADQLTFSSTNDNSIIIDAKNANISLEDNLVYKAASQLQQRASRQAGCYITLEKNIPIGGGLGGGSSDAATTLLALNKLWKLNLELNELCAIGKNLGADVPVFIHGYSAWGEGIGEQLSPITIPTKYYVILKPNCYINTKDLYQHSQLNRNSKKINRKEYQVGMGHNDFEPLAAKLKPEIKAALNWLSQHGKARLTGSGACLFATFDTCEEATRIAKIAPKKWLAITTKGCNKSPVKLLLEQD